MSKTKMGRRIASLLLSLVMVLSLLPTTVYATTAKTGDTNAVIVSEKEQDTVIGQNAEGENVSDEAKEDAAVQSGEGDAGTSTAVAWLDGVGYATLAEAIEAAQDGDTITLGEGKFTTYGNASPKKSLTFVGAGEGTVWTIGDLTKNVGGEGNGDYSFDGCDTITFKNMTLKSDGVDYRGFIRINNTVAENCILEGKTAYWGYDSATFKNCTFNAPEGDYALWDYSSKEMHFDGCTFNISGKGVNVYNERGTDARTVSVNDCTIYSTQVNKAFLNIKNTTQEYNVVISGTNKVTGLDEDATTGSALYQVETTDISTSGKPVKIQVEAADGTLTTVYEVKAASAAVAKIGETEYATLDAALADVTADKPLTWVAESVWPSTTPVYYNGDFYRGTSEVITMKGALEYAIDAANEANSNDAAKIYVRPGYNADGTAEALVKQAHQPIKTSIAIYGNDAKLSKNWEPCVEKAGTSADDGAHLLTKDISVALYNLHGGAGLWGTRVTDYTVDLIMENCEGAYQIMFYGVEENGSQGKTNITVKNTKFDATTKEDHNVICIIGAGDVMVENSEFKAANINIKNVNGGGNTVSIKNTQFTDTVSDAQNVRVRGFKEDTTISVALDGVSFDGKAVKNIEIGEESQGTISYTINNTSGNLNVYKKGAEAAETTELTGTEVTGSNAAASTKGTKENPYTLDEFGKMTRAEYIAAQEALAGTMYVDVGDYRYDQYGTLGNGERNDTVGQTPDHSKLNAYGENGYLGDKNDGANGKNVVFVGSSITSGVTGYASIDNIGTYLLLAVPAYTNVTFEGIIFNNVMNFNYQLYTSPWSQLGSIEFNQCTFNGIIVGSVAAQTLAFRSCEFKDYTNTVSANNSNPTWIRPAYGNWTKGDNEGQGDGFKSLTAIIFENNTVTSTRPVKFERIAQWEMDTKVTVTGNDFDITGDGSNKNVGMYFGANAKFTLVADNNTKSDNTAALYTAVYSAPNGSSYAGLPAGSTVQDANGTDVTLDANVWKSTDKLTLKTTAEVAELTNSKNVSVKFATLQEAFDAATDGETVKLLADVTPTETLTVSGKSITLDLNGKSIKNSVNAITVAAGAGLTVTGNGTVEATGKYKDGIENNGTLVVENGTFVGCYGAVRALGGSTTTINGGTFSSSDKHYGLYYWANGTALSVTVNGGTFEHSVSTAMENGKVTLKVNGGTFVNDLSAYCPDGFGTVEDSTGKFVYGTVSAPSGYVEDENGNVTISDEDGLFWFAKQVNEKGNTFSGKTVTLANDITLTKAWEPVGVSVQNPFKGTFDGAGHTITGLKVAGTYQGYGFGFFGTVISATVKNVTFENADVTGIYSNIVGIVVGYSYGSSTYENVHVNNSTVYAFGKVGGIVGYAEDKGATTTFRNCSVTNSTIHGGYNTAGFLGLVQGKCSISGSYLANNEVIIDENAQGFGALTELDTTVVCDGSVATCAGNGTVIKGKYLPNGGYYWSAWSDLYNHYGDSSHDCTLADGKLLANSEVVHNAPVAIGDVLYSDLQAAFDAAKTGDTVKLLDDITLTEQVNITKALNGLTLDGNGKTITCATTTDPNKSGGSALYFGNATDKLYCTGIKIMDLTMTGTARFAIFLCGGTTTEFTNVKISGDYLYAVNLYGTHGATMTNCEISNSKDLGTENEGGAAIWSNVASANPLKLVNSKVGIIAINKYTSANTLEPKIFIDKESSAEIHTLDDGTVSGNKKLCVSTESEGAYTIKEYDETSASWVEVKDYVAEVGGVKYESLQAAFDAAKNKTVTLLANVDGNFTISQYKTTLDLNGFTINGGTTAGKPALTITNNATIKDTSAAQTGTIKREDTAENSGKSSHYVIDIQSGVTIFEGGTVTNNSGTADSSKGASLVRIGDDSYPKYPQLTIMGGTFTQDNFVVIKVDRGTLFVSGGELNSANSYAVESWGTATIKGGTVNGDVAAWTYAGGNNSTMSVTGGTINGSLKAINYGSTTDKTVKVDVTGGTITGALGTYTYSGEYAETDTLATIAVTGGTFDVDPTKYLAEGATATKVDGKYTVEKAYLAKVGETSYYTMDEAFKAQTTSGEAIVMLRDYTTNKNFNSGSIARVVDLNGHTWTYTGTDASEAAFEINYSNATLTVKNGTVVSGSMIGLIPSAMSGTITYNNSALVFENVVMTANGRSGIETNGLNTNDTVTLKNSTLNVPNGYGIYFPSSGTLTLENAKVNAKTMGVQVCAGSLNISGSETAISVTGDAVIKTENDGAIEDGAAISIVNRPGYKDIESVTITGGTFTAKDTAVKAYTWKNKTASEWTDAAKCVAISGGTFSSIPDNMPALCTKGYRAVENDNSTYTVSEGKYVIKVTSRLKGTEQTVATPTGGGSGDYGDVITVSTNAVAGFKFLGWYAVGQDEQLANTTTYRHTVTGDCELVAMYESDTTRMFRLTVNGTVFKVDGREEYTHYYNEIASGREMQIEYTGTDNFLYWVNASKNIVTTSKTLNYTMVNDAEFTAVTAPATSNSAMVVFKNNIVRGQELQARRYYTDDSIVFPANPNSYGRAFAYWAILDADGNIMKDATGNVIVATEEAIKAEIAKGTGYIVVAAVYTADASYKITVHFVDSNDESVANNRVNENVPTGSGWTVTAPEVTGKFFSHWKDTDGNILSTNQTYAIYAMADTEVTAVYVDSEDAKQEPMNTVKLTAQAVVQKNGSHSVYLNVQYDISSGEISDVGVLWTIDAAQSDNLTVENKNVSRSGINNPESTSNVYRHELNNISDTSKVIYARAYVTLTNGETIYCNVISGSFNTWNAN